MDCSILDIIDKADSDGVYTFVVRRQAVPAEAKGGGLNILRELLRSHFNTFTTCVIKTSHRWTDGLDASASVSERGDWTVQLNLARFFRLPALHPRAELAELRSFLEAMKLFFEEHVNCHTVIDIFNSRSATSAAIECKYPVIGGLATFVDKAHTARLRALVDDSALLQTFLKNLVGSSHTVGPWAFDQVHETMLYGLVEGPAISQYLEQQRAALRFFNQSDAEMSPAAA